VYRFFAYVTCGESSYLQKSYRIYMIASHNI